MIDYIEKITCRANNYDSICQNCIHLFRLSSVNNVRGNREQRWHIKWMIITCGTSSTTKTLFIYFSHLVTIFRNSFRKLRLLSEWITSTLQLLLRKRCSCFRSFWIEKSLIYTKWKGQLALLLSNQKKLEVKLFYNWMILVIVSTALVWEKFSEGLFGSSGRG